MKDPRYPFDRVQSVESLRHPLGVLPTDLAQLARRASDMYFVAKTQLKADGSTRILYDTQEPLKIVLKRINENFLKRVIYPSYLTGGLPGKDYTHSVRVHAGAKVVVKEDISQFFPSVSHEVVFDIWKNFFGFAAEVAELLTMLTVRDGHLEQGAPTSGYLANLALWDIEGQFVKNLAAQGFTQYSRHVDDITFSSLSHVSPSRINWAVRTVTKSLATKGLLIHQGKHEVMHSNGQLKILKLVGNSKPSLPPKERSRVRALIHTFSKKVESGDDLEDALQMLPRMRGQAYKVKRFHSREGGLLVEQVEKAAVLLRLQPSNADVYTGQPN